MSCLDEFDYIDDGWKAVLSPIEPQIAYVLNALKSKYGYGDTSDVVMPGTNGRDRDTYFYNARGKSFLPAYENIFRAFAVPYDKVKVLILGQDPYPNKEHATGLAFSVKRNIRPLPKSLQNIFKELNDDIGDELRKNPKSKENYVVDSEFFADDILGNWLCQGVMLLNTSLTVEEGAPQSHKNLGWYNITCYAIRALALRKDKPLVAILWGKNAIDMKFLFSDTSDLDESKNAFPKRKKADFAIMKFPPNIKIKQSVHPSPLSANRGFFGSKPFSETNKFLLQSGENPINWNV